MNDENWERMEFGPENYNRLINEAGARPLTQEEDLRFLSAIRKLLIKNTSTINWNEENLTDVSTVRIDGNPKDGDIYVLAAIDRLNVDGDDLIWVGWHDQDETIEIQKKKLTEYILPILFVGYGAFMMNVQGEWLIEYKFEEFVSAGRFRLDKK